MWESHTRRRPDQRFRQFDYTRLERKDAMQRKKAHTGGALFYLGAAIYVGLIILFAWQTWAFVDWLFPSDQLLFKLLTVLCFDVMAVFWAATDLFYRFAVKGARTLVRWAWAISFVLSVL